MKSLRKTKIVGTIGPASENRLEELFDAGLNVCRVNYSHGSWDEQKEKTEAILKIREEKDLPIALLLDTCVYIVVVEISLCPNISWIERKSASFSNKWVANVWRNVWGVTCFFKPLFLTIFSKIW